MNPIVRDEILKPALLILYVAAVLGLYIVAGIAMFGGFGDPVWADPGWEKILASVYFSFVTVRWVLRTMLGRDQ